MDWINIYITKGTMIMLSKHIQGCSGYVLNQEGCIEDPKQGMCSVTVNLKPEYPTPFHAVFAKRDDNDQIVGYKKQNLGSIEQTV